MADTGLVFACFGCCCGHTNNGAVRIVRPALRRASLIGCGVTTDLGAVLNTVRVPAGPGLGVSLSDAALAKFKTL